MNALIYFLLEGNYLLQRVGGAALSLKSPPTLPSIPRAVWFTRWPTSTGESPASQLRASDARPQPLGLRVPKQVRRTRHSLDKGTIESPNLRDLEKKLTPWPLSINLTLLEHP